MVSLDKQEIAFLWRRPGTARECVTEHFVFYSAKY